MGELKQADLTFHADITIGATVIEKVLCKIYLPTKMVDEIDVIFYPNDEQAKIIEKLPFWKMSFRGEVINFSEKVEQSIVSEKTYANKFNKVVHNKNFTEPYLKAHPSDLTVIHHLNHPAEIKKVEGNFWITKNNLLEPFSIPVFSYTGEVKIEKLDCFEFNANEYLKLKFNNFYKRYKNNDGDNVTFHELVASFELDDETNESPKILESLRYLDDILLLASFAARQKCVCLGWDSYDFNTFVTKYLRDRVIPTISDKRGNSYEELIEPIDFKEFMESVFMKFQNYKDIEAFRRTLNIIVPRYKDTEMVKFKWTKNSLSVLHFLFSIVPQIPAGFGSPNSNVI